MEHLNLSKKVFYKIWMKGKHFQKLDEFEQLYYDLMEEHPEYYVYYEIADTDSKKVNTDAVNPFLHLSLHYMFREQLKSKEYLFLNKALEILKEKFGKHNSEHILINVMLEFLLNSNGNFKNIPVKDYENEINKTVEEYKNKKIEDVINA